MNRNIKNQINNVLQGFSQIKLAFLYGSSLKRDINEIEDIDIAISGLNKIDFNILVDIQLALEKELKKKVDLVDLNTLNGLIQQQILCTGEIIFCLDQNLYVQIITRMLTFQEDILPFYKSAIKKRIERYIDG